MNLDLSRPLNGSGKYKEPNRSYYLAHRDEILAKKKERYHSDTETGSAAREYQKNFRAELKKIVYDHYGWVCNCCGESEVLFLSIDHVNNDGATHRKTLGRSNKGTDLQVYRDIIREEFPDTYQILCMNCNSGKARNGGVCPHQTKEGSKLI